jgi:lipid-A-disaccharide synthase
MFSGLNKKMPDNKRSLFAGKILMVAGEPSGDRHGADLARALQGILPKVKLWGMGGDAMCGAGVELKVHMREVSVVGIVEVLGHLGAAFRCRKALMMEVDRDPPALAILIDFPDFNLWLARALKRRGIPLMYYIAPQVWAWRRRRLRLMARLLDRMAVILPFEESLFRDAGIISEYVGHPLVEQTPRAESKQQACAVLGLPPDAPVLGLLPGSRSREVEHILPVMLEGVKQVQKVLSDVQAVVALSPLVSKSWVEEKIREYGLVARAVQGHTHHVIRASRLAVVASGTATLEIALLETPMVVVYRASWISYALGRLLVRVKHIALVNILAGERIVPELLQNDLTSTNIRDHVLGLWRDEGARQEMVERLRLVGESLGSRRASQRAARMVLDMMRGLA